MECLVEGPLTGLRPCMMHFPPARKFYDMTRYRLAQQRAAHVSDTAQRQVEAEELAASGQQMSSEKVDAGRKKQGVRGKRAAGIAHSFLCHCMTEYLTNIMILHLMGLFIVPMAAPPTRENFDEAGSDMGLAAFTANIPTMGMSAAATMFTDSDFGACRVAYRTPLFAS